MFTNVQGWITPLARNYRMLAQRPRLMSIVFAVYLSCVGHWTLAFQTL